MSSQARKGAPVGLRTIIQGLWVLRPLDGFAAEVTLGEVQ